MAKHLESDQDFVQVLNNFFINKQMADFEQNGEMDLPQMQEASEESQDKFQERLAAAQKALKQLKKDEGKRKKQDNHLARILKYFLQKPGNTDLANLVADLIAKDIPSDFLLALLAIVDHSSREVIMFKKEQHLLNGRVSSQQALSLPNLEQPLDPVVKAQINTWIENIYLIAQAETEKLMEKSLDQNLKIDVNLLQLAAFLLQRFLRHKKIPQDYQTIYTFIHLTFEHLYQRLQIQFAEKMCLQEKN